MKKLMTYLNRHRIQTILAPLFKMLEAAFELIVPLVVARMIDTGVANRDVSYLIRQGIILVLLGVIGFAAAVTAQYFSANVAVITGTALRNDLFRHIQTLSWRQIDEMGTSTLITRMTSDINTVQNGVNMFLRLFLRSPFVVLGAVVMAFTVDQRTAMVFAVAVPVLAEIIFAILLVTMPLYKNVQKKLDTIMRMTRENLLGVRVVRAFNRQEDEKKLFDTAAADYYRKQIFVGKISALLNPLTYVVINAGIIGILWVGGLQVDLGNLTRGEVIALVNYMSQILVEMIKLANLIILLSRAIASMKRVDTVFAMKNSMKDGEASLPSCLSGGMEIDFRKVTFAYEKEADPALSGISFHAAGGSTLGIIGGTGSGKSTIVHLLGRFYDPDQGEISVNGKDLRNLKIEDLRRHIGFVPQKAVLFAGSLRENMKWGDKDATDEEIYRALDIAQAREFVDQKGEGLNLSIEQEGRNLSGGQRQRLTIARALVRNPELLILDDSASALDFATDAKLRKAIRESKGSSTVILVSQRVSTIRNADRILVLDDGQAAGFGSHRELLGNCEVYREICQSQMTEEEIARDLGKGGDQA
uniref:ABC transporter ATP-binding protein n=1 Tax=Eubacterium cellulosolvens TaxID=29322 RepID=UPI0004838F5E|nr:ABC transporter ATP-binding protein [[Eubacterium] cellulosolvens]